MASLHHAGSGDVFRGALSVGGVLAGLSGGGYIWVVTVVSVTSLLLLEPVVIWGLFQEFPGRGALIGFCLGALGMLATVLL